MSENKGWNKVTLANLGDGAAVELFDSAMNEVYANIQDLNTDRLKAREVHLIVKVKPDEHFRENNKVSYSMRVDKKLAMHPGVESFLIIGSEEGEFVGYEQEGFQPPLPNVGTGNITPIIKKSEGGQL